MYRSYALQPVHPHIDRALRFEWDDETGDLRGPDAYGVRELVDQAVEQGTVTGRPYPTPYDIHDPLHSLAEMAVVLGNCWRLSDDLAAAYPRAEPDDAPPGAVY